jgi:hypothetical protein
LHRPLVSVCRCRLMIDEITRQPVVCLTHRVLPLLKFLLPAAFCLPTRIPLISDGAIAGILTFRQILLGQRVARPFGIPSLYISHL